MTQTARKKRPAKIKAGKREPIRIGNKIIRLSRQAVMTITDVDSEPKAALK